MLNNKVGTMTIVGIILIIVGIALIVCDPMLVYNAKRCIGLLGFAGMVLRYVKTEYCVKEEAK